MEGKWANIKRKFLEVKNFLDPVIKYTPPRCLSELLELQDVPDIILWLLVSVWFFLVLSHTLWMSAKSLQLCPTFCDPMDCSPPGSSAHGILQVGILEWVSMPSFKWLNLVSGITCIGRSVNCKVCPILFLDSWYQSGSFQLYPALRELKFFDLCLGDSLVSRFQFDAWDSSWGCWWETEIVSSSSNGLECGLWQTALGDFWKQTYGCFGLVVVAWLLSHVQLFVTPWSATCQTSLITFSQSLLKLMSIESVMHLTISSSATFFSSSLQYLSPSRSFPAAAKGWSEGSGRPCWGFWKQTYRRWGSYGRCEATLQLLSYLNAWSIGSPSGPLSLSGCESLQPCSLNSFPLEILRK